MPRNWIWLKRGWKFNTESERVMEEMYLQRNRRENVKENVFHTELPFRSFIGNILADDSSGRIKQ